MRYALYGRVQRSGQRGKCIARKLCDSRYQFRRSIDRSSPVGSRIRALKLEVFKQFYVGECDKKNSDSQTGRALISPLYDSIVDKGTPG